jgi:hypothetical protein
MWLNDEYGLDIRCVRLQPYSHAAGIFVDAQQVIPLPEAADYQVQLRKKQQEERKENIERVELRERFYVGLLDRAKARGSVPIEFTLSKGAYAVSISSGFVGFPFVYVAMKDAARVELYIDRYGRRQFNKSAYDYLHGKREQIEGAFGGELLWERLDEKNACRISCTDTAGGYRSNVSEWPRIQDQMVDAMIRLSAALSQHLQAAIDTAELAQANPVGQSSPTPA